MRCEMFRSRGFTNSVFYELSHLCTWKIYFNWGDPSSASDDKLSSWIVFFLLRASLLSLTVRLRRMSLALLMSSCTLSLSEGGRLSMIHMLLTFLLCYGADMFLLMGVRSWCSSDHVLWKMTGLARVVKSRSWGWGTIDLAGVFSCIGLSRFS